MQPSNGQPGRTADPLLEFARVFGLISGLLGVVIGAVGVVIGISGDAVLNEAAVELAAAGLITVVALLILLIPWPKARVRPIGMAAAAVAYVVAINQFLLPWIDTYRTAISTGTEPKVWEEAVAVPLLVIGGLLMIVSAAFLWPAAGSDS